MKEFETNQTEKQFLGVELSSTDNVSLIHVSGSLVGKAVSKFRHACSEAQKVGLTHRVIDLSEVDEIDGYGIAGLVGLLARRRKAGGEVVLCGVNPDLRLRLEATHCTSVFKMAVSASGAVELLKDGSK